MRRFFLGVGAQKAGTTWFYDQLSKSENFKKTATKELHILDAIYLHKLPFRKKILDQFSKTVSANHNNFGKSFISKKMHMLFDTEKYFDYFDEIIGDGEFSCDITPTYSGLPVEAFELVKRGFDERGIDVSVVFLVREPVSRLDSAMRMHVRLNQGFNGISPEQMMEVIKKNSKSYGDNIRSNYKNTYEKITSVFGEESCFIGVFESLFTEHQQKRISEFTGIPTDFLAPDSPSNKTKNTFRYKSSDIDELRNQYNEQYEFAVNQLGIDEKLWTDALDRLRQ